jgi:MFS family permease
MARWADRGNRVSLTSIAIGLWGLTVMSCLFVANFTQLVASRIAAAVGEAGCMPPTYSLVGDYFPAPAGRVRAMAIYLTGAPIAWLASFSLGGWLNDLYGWRAAFFAMGVPGLLVAAVVKLTITEPRASSAGGAVSQQRLPPLRQVLGSLWHQRSSRHLILAVILTFTTQIGLIPWYAAFLIRSHGATTGELGAWLGPIFVISGTSGLLIGVYVVDRWIAADERGQLRWTALITALFVPCFVSFLLLPQKSGALISLVPIVVCANCILGPTFALLQRLVIPEMRATTMSIVMLVANLVGMGVGSQGVGVLSDVLVPSFGNDSLRYAMLFVALLSIWSAWHFWQAARTVRADLAVLATHARYQT